LPALRLCSTLAAALKAQRSHLNTSAATGNRCAVLCFADILSAARLLDTVVQSGVQRYQRLADFYIAKAMLTTLQTVLQTVPAVQQIPLEIYIGMLQSSTSTGFLLDVLLQLPQAQHVTPSMLVRLLAGTAKHNQPLLLANLLRYVD
jgi:hypothetical protein